MESPRAFEPSSSLLFQELQFSNFLLVGLQMKDLQSPFGAIQKRSEVHLVWNLVQESETDGHLF
jgi:hypothetical protein